MENLGQVKIRGRKISDSFKLTKDGFYLKNKMYKEQVSQKKGGVFSNPASAKQSHTQFFTIE